MSHETPAARWLREQNEAADAAEAEGRYEEARLAEKFGAGEVTFDEVLQLFRDGKVFRRPKPHADPVTLTEIEDNTYVDDFWLFTIFGRQSDGTLAPSREAPLLTAEQYTELKLARSGYAGDRDQRNTRQELQVALPPPPEGLTGTGVEFLGVYVDGAPVALLLVADGSDNDVFRLQVDPAEWVPVPTTWNLAHARANGSAVPLDFDKIEELIRSGALVNPTEESLGLLGDLQERPDRPTDRTATASPGKKLLGMAHLGKPVKDLTDEEIDQIAKDLAAKIRGQLLARPGIDEPVAAPAGSMGQSDPSVGGPNGVAPDKADSDRRQSSPLRRNLPAPPPGVAGEDVRLYSVSDDQSVLALLMLADERLFRLQADPPTWVTAPSSSSLEYGQAVGCVTPLDAESAEQLLNSDVLKNLTWESLDRLRDLLEPDASDIMEAAGVMWHSTAARRYFDGSLSLEDLISAIAAGRVTQEMDYARDDTDDEYFEDPFRSRGGEPDGGTERYRQIVEAYRKLEEETSINLVEWGNWYPSATVGASGTLSVTVSDFSESMQDRSYGVRLDGRKALVYLVNTTFVGPGSLAEFLEYCDRRGVSVYATSGNGSPGDGVTDEQLSIKFDTAAPWCSSRSGVYVVVGWRDLLLALFRDARGSNPVERAESVATAAGLECERWGLGPVI